MSLKLKGLCLSVMALALSAFATIGASASTGGHFISEAEHTIVNQTSSPSSPHFFEMVIPGLTGMICDEVTATGTAIGTTITQPVGNLSATKCKTTGGTAGETMAHFNGCQVRPTVASGNPQTTEQTLDLTCPEGKTIEITHGGCIIKVPAQNNLGGLTYTSVIDNGKHAITADVNVTLTYHFEAGFCILLGTKKTGLITGSTLVRGLNSKGEQVGITAT